MRREKITGILVVLFITFCAYLVKNVFPFLDTLLLGFFIGLAFRVIAGGKNLTAGFTAAERFALPAGIILYGAHINFLEIFHVDTGIWMQLPLQILTVFLLSVWIGRKHFPSLRIIFLLLAAGISLGSIPSVLLVSKVIPSGEKDIGITITTMTLIGLIGVFLYPLIMIWLALNRTVYAYFCATTLQTTGMIQAASSTCGSSCLDLAQNIINFRAAFILPVILLLRWSLSRPDASADTGGLETESSPKKQGFPYMIWGLLSVSLFLLFFSSPVLIKHTKNLALVLLTVTLTGIGLNTKLEDIYNIGGIPIIMGALFWLIGISLFLLKNGLWAY